MTTWRVTQTRQAAEALRTIHRPDQLRIAGAIELLQTHPFPPASRRLKGRDAWLVRVGDYRIIYTVDHEEITILVIRIGHRREVYRFSPAGGAAPHQRGLCRR